MDFIACAAELTRRSSNYRFRIIGDGPMRRRCADACAGAKITVDFAGQVGDVGPQLDKCDLLAIPSHAEGFSMATIEAMARGVAVVAYPTGGLPEIIDHGKTGLLSLTDTPAALADAVARLLTEKQMYDSVSAAGIRYVTAKFSADRYRSQWSDLFAFVAQERTPGSPASETLSSGRSHARGASTSMTLIYVQVDHAIDAP